MVLSCTHRCGQGSKPTQDQQRLRHAWCAHEGCSSAGQSLDSEGQAGLSRLNGTDIGIRAMAMTPAQA